MDCFECAKANDRVAAVGVCPVGGTFCACPHEIPRVKPLRGAPAGVEASARHHSTIR